VSTGYSQIRNKVLTGETNDENTYVFKGIAGHAGLFGTASDVSSLAQYLVDSLNNKTESPIISKQTLTKIFERNADGSEWAYGWHYPTANSTAGSLISKNSVGMTGFTGTSIWMDFDRDLIITILANRTVAADSAKFGWNKDRFTDIRPQLHDIIIGELIG